MKPWWRNLLEDSVKLASFLCVFLLIVEHPRQANGIWFQLGAITPTNPLALVNDILELNCTVFDGSGLSASMLFWEKNGTRLREDTMITVGEHTLLLKKNITSVDEEGTYTCKSINDDIIQVSSLVVEYEAVREVTNISCILHKIRDELTCTWELGLYHHPVYLKINSSVSMDNGVTLKYCKQNVEEKCTWTQDDGAIYSATKIVILEIENRKYGVSKSFRRDHITRDITKYGPTKFIHTTNPNTMDCECANISWHGISGGVDTSSRVALKSKWEAIDISFDVDLNTSLVVCDLVPDTTYKVMVQVKPLRGMYFSDVNQRSFVTCSREPTKSASVHASGYSSNICYDFTSRRNVTIYWKRIPRKYQNGNLTRYTISFGNINVHIDQRKLSGKIELPCKKSSILSIRGCNKDGCSPESKITIPPFTEAVLPSKVVAEHLNTSGVDLTWFHGEGQIAVDVVWCKVKLGLFQCQDEVNFLRLNGTDNHTSISSDDIDSRIDDVIFGVAIINEKQLSGGIRWQDACRYQKNLEPKKITDVKLLPDASENSLIVSWSPILCDSSNINNAYVHSYQVISCRLDSQNHCIGEKSSVELSATSNTQHTLRNLHPDVNHGVWVRARSLTRAGPMSDMVSGIPTNDDLTTSAVAGIIIAGIFIFVVMLAGGVCILRNIRQKLGLGETFPIHIPDLESEKPYEKFLTTPSHYTGDKSPNYISTEREESLGSVHSACTERDQCTSEEKLLKFLTKNLPDKSDQANTTGFPVIDIPSGIGRDNENDGGEMNVMEDNNNLASSMTNLKEKQKIKRSKVVLPPGYAKVLSSCIHEIDRSLTDTRKGPKDSTSDSNEIILERVLSEENNLKQNEVHPSKPTKADMNETPACPKHTTNDQSLMKRTYNDENYITNDASYWNKERELSVINTNNESQKSQSSLPSNLKQAMSSAGNKGMSPNPTNYMTNIVVGDNNTNIDDESYRKITPAINSDDYVDNNFLTNYGVHNDSKINNISIIDTSVNSSNLSKHLASNFCQNAEMCLDYVPTDTIPGEELRLGNRLNTKQSSDYIPNDTVHKSSSENNIDSMGYISHSGAMEGSL